MKIFYADDSKYFLDEAKDRGLLDCVYLLYNDKYYKITIYDKIRLIQDVNEEIRTEGAFTAIPNLIIANTITYEDIVLAIKKAVNEKIIEYFYPCEVLNDKIIYIKSVKRRETLKKLGFPYYVNKSELKEFLAD